MNNRNLFLIDLEAEVQDQRDSMVGFWWEPSSGLQMADFLYPHIAGREIASSLASSYEGINPIHEGSTFMT